MTFLIIYLFKSIYRSDLKLLAVLITLLFCSKVQAIDFKNADRDINSYQTTISDYQTNKASLNQVWIAGAKARKSLTKIKAGYEKHPLAPKINQGLIVENGRKDEPMEAVKDLDWLVRSMKKRAEK